MEAWWRESRESGESKGVDGTAEWYHTYLVGVRVRFSPHSADRGGVRSEGHVWATVQAWRLHLEKPCLLRLWQWASPRSI